MPVTDAQLDAAFPAVPPVSTTPVASPGNVTSGNTGPPLNLPTYQDGLDPEVHMAEIRAGRNLHNNARDLIASAKAQGAPDWVISEAMHRLLEPVSDGGTIAQIPGLIQSARQKYQINRSQAGSTDAAAQAITWPEPEDILGENVEAAVPFPLEFLPDTFQAFVRDGAERLQIPPDFLALPMIVSAGAVVGKCFRLAPKAHDSWSERPCFFGAIVSGPSTSKTPAFEEALAPIRKFQVEMREAYTEEMETHEGTVEQAKFAERQWKADCRKAEKDGKELPAKPDDATPPEPPIMKRVLVGDITQEKIVALMAQNPDGLLLYRDELRAVFEGLNQYRDGADRQFLLECHSGGMYTKDRVQGSSVILDDMFLCVFGGVQPGILKKVMAGGDQDGMTARFSLMVYPDVLEDFEYIDRHPNREAAQKVEAVMRKLREMDVEDFFGPADPLNPDRERVFRFSQSAQKTFETWYTNINQQIRTEDLDDALKAHMNKYPGLFARLALIHHLIRRAEGSARSPTEVSNTTAQAVASFIDSYLSPHAQRIYRLLGQHPAHGGARRIAQWLKSELPFEAFSSRDIKQKNWSGLHDDKHVIVALDCLETKGWIKGQEIPPGPLGGRRTIRFLINQKIWGV